MAKCGSCGQEIPAPEEITAYFDLFWKLYPKKDDKLAARRAFNRLSMANREAAIKDLERGRYNGVERTYIPLPSTYINRQRWNDEFPTQTIPDPPKPAQPDGGMARRPVKSLAERWTEVMAEEEDRAMSVSAEVGRACLAEILKSLKVKSI